MVQLCLAAQRTALTSINFRWGFVDMDQGQAQPELPEAKQLKALAVV